MVKCIIIFAAIIAGIYFYSKKIYESEYIYADLKNNPVSAEKIIDDWYLKRADLCRQAVEAGAINTTSESCLERSEKFGEMCKSRIVKDYPALIDSLETAKHVGKRYLNCIIP